MKRLRKSAALDQLRANRSKSRRGPDLCRSQIVFRLLQNRRPNAPRSAHFNQAAQFGRCRFFVVSILQHRLVYSEETTFSPLRGTPFTVKVNKPAILRARLAAGPSFRGHFY